MKYYIEKQMGDCWSLVISSTNYCYIKKLLSYYERMHNKYNLRVVNVIEQSEK